MLILREEGDVARGEGAPEDVTVAVHNIRVVPGPAIPTG